MTGWYSRLGRRARISMWTALVVWLCAGVLAFGGWTAIRERVARRSVAARPSADLVLAVVHADAPDLPVLALLHRGPSGRDVVLLPAGTVVEVPGAAPESLAAALASHGPEVVAVSVANVLGVRIPSTLVASPDRFRSTINEMGGLEVDVPEQITVEESGFRRTLFGRGRTRMHGEEFLRFLTMSVAGQTELDRVARQYAAWRALIARVGAPLQASRAAAAFEPWDGQVDGRAAQRLFAAVAADTSARLATLPVRGFGLTSRADLYAVERSDMGPLHRNLADVLTVRSTDGRRVRLLVGADGAVGPAAARALIDAGYSIVLSGRASKPYDETRAVMAEDTDQLRAQANAILELMGTGRIGLSKAPQSLVDVTLVVGRDWAEAHGFPQATPSPTAAPRKTATTTSASTRRSGSPARQGTSR